VRLPEQAEAFLPLSEISNRRVKKPHEVLEEGQEIEPTILDLKPDERRMVLSLRDPSAADYERYSGGGGGGDEDRRGGMKRGGMKRGGKKRHDENIYDVPSATSRVPTGGATIGERLGMLKGIKGVLKNEDHAEEPAPAPAAAPEPKLEPKSEPKEVRNRSKPSPLWQHDCGRGVSTPRPQCCSRSFA